MSPVKRVFAKIMPPPAANIMIVAVVLSGEPFLSEWVKTDMSPSVSRTTAAICNPRFIPHKITGPKMIDFLESQMK